ncbi:MAG: V-type ATP synthase subunit D [Filifactoraceae bacterium]
MIQNIAPTKSNLLRTKDNLRLSKTGYNLIDKKRTVLIKEMMQQIEKAKEIQEDVKQLFEKAYAILQEANITIGVRQVQEISMSIDKSEHYDISYKSVMGLDVPSVKYEKENLRPHYSMHMTSSSIDEAIKIFHKIKRLTYRLAETENTVYKLSVEIKKNQKRANALDKIQIPRLEGTVKYISESLEEKEREDFYRLKKIKKKKSIV